MIWVRRVLAIPLIIIFVLIFILALVLSHLSGTVGSAGFYNGQMKKADVYEWVYDTMMPAVMEEIEVESPTDFPIDTPQLKEHIVSVAETAFPADWLEDTFENATRHVVPYVVGDKKTFSITIDVRDRIDPMVSGEHGIYWVIDQHSTELWEYVTQDLIAPAVTEQLSQNTELPYGVALTDEEVSNVVAQAMPEDWAIPQFKSMIGSLADYMNGTTSSLNLNIILGDVRSNTDTAVTALAKQKVEDTFDGLQPTYPGSVSQYEAELAGLAPDTLPGNRPPGYTYDSLPAALRGEIETRIDQEVQQNVVDMIPNSYRFNEDQLREMMGEDMADTLDDAHEFIVDDHGRLTNADLYDAEDSEEFDNARQIIHTVKMWIWALWLVAILLLVAIGFLCGRNWKSRLLWPLCILCVTSLIFVIVVAVANAVAPYPDRFVDRPEGSDVSQLEIVVTDKADEIAHNAIDTLVWGLELKLILFIVFSALAIAGVIVWMVMDKRRQQALTQHDPDAPAP